MLFELDEAKNLANIRKHGIDFNDAMELFQQPYLAQRDDRENYAEERWINLGRIRSLIGVVVSTEREGDVIRIISARKATRREARHYVQTIEN
ncbi:BrnT family toxin [Pseudomonas sp. BGr12]|uniref:BrnT family toxin n=1 Tax=unclassified Pseudomonas TaxID=196821 RepID=UPI00177B1630|nr:MULTISPECIES: BrnT family toxin [unclassified Pseudomonas]MBD9501546.1 BrnT family toxin [Pseudomonas sp. PDM17]MDL2427164.1 BrnT family toxin [Pseudomonas sp. BJa5]